MGNRKKRFGRNRKRIIGIDIWLLSPVKTEIADGRNRKIPKPEVTLKLRVWNIWPDEFVLGETIVKTLKADPVKKEYVAASSDGMTIVERRFNELDSLLKWSLNIRDLKLTNTRELEPDDYFVRITVESRLRRLPPVISYLFFFVPEKEFTKVKDSSRFSVGQEK